MTRNTFKQRYNGHKTTFSNFKHHKDTELSKEVWKTKRKGGDCSVSWRIIRQHQDYNQATKRCALCLNEKYEILEYKGANLINSRSEIVSKCRHQLRYMIDKQETSSI